MMTRLIRKKLIHMTASNDRRHRIQQYSIPLVRKAISDMVYGEDNKRIVTDLYIGDLTYEQAAERANMTTSGLYKRMRRVMPPVEDYLKRIN